MKGKRQESKRKKREKRHLLRKGGIAEPALSSRSPSLVLSGASETSRGGGGEDDGAKCRQLPPKGLRLNRTAVEGSGKGKSREGGNL